MPVSGSHTVTISSLSAGNMGGTRRSEASELYWAYEAALQKMVASNLTSVAIIDRAGNNLGTMTWTPLNSV